MGAYLIKVLIFTWPAPAQAVDWLQETPIVFNQLRGNRSLTCEETINIINGEMNALECSIKSATNRRVSYTVALTASPAPSGKWIEMFSIVVQPLHALPDGA